MYECTAQPAAGLKGPCKRTQQVTTLLRVVGQQCCVGLYGPKNLTGFKLYATSTDKCQHCCGSLQTEATCWAQHCCVLLDNNAASVYMGLKSCSKFVNLIKTVFPAFRSGQYSQTRHFRVVPEIGKLKRVL